MAAAAKELPYVDFLTGRLDTELPFWCERDVKAKPRLACLSIPETLADFDLSCQPSVDERQIHEPDTLTFASSASNVILLGPPGVGRTHVAVPLGLKPSSRAWERTFVTAHDRVADLRRASAESRLDSGCGSTSPRSSTR